MDTQFVFVYGTLMSHCSEHARFCPSPLSISEAEICGTLFEIEGGYPIMKIPQENILLEASDDLIGDWKKAWETPTSPPPGISGMRWIKGELLELPLEKSSLSRMDAWEGFEPGQPSVYQRVATWAKRGDDLIAKCWLYASLGELPGAKRLDVSAWKRSS